MDEFDDNLGRLAASGLSRRRSSIVAPSLKLSLSSSEKRGSVDSGGWSGSEGGGVRPAAKSSYRVVVMGASRVGKTSIISQFLYDQFQSRYKATVEEMYRGEFEVGNVKLSLDIEDTSGTFACDFPAMVEVSVSSADAVLLVFSVGDTESFEQVAQLRDMVMKSRGPDMPMVVVGNKTDLERKVDMVETEALVQCDWENGYVECSAKHNVNIQDVFKELLSQVRSQFDFFPSMSNSSSHTSSPVNMRRRQSLPVVPVFSLVPEGEQGGRRREGRRRSSLAVVLGRESCKIS
jgi:small GTP-binding protein